MADLSKLGAYRDVNSSNFNFNDRLSGDSSGLQTSGRQSYTNIFRRAFQFLTRSEAEIQSNKQTAADFRDRLKDAFGSEIADVFSRDLQGQLEKGRPLTAYRVKVTIDKARMLAEKNQGLNEKRLDSVMPQLVKDVWKGLTYGLETSPDPSALSDKQMENVLRDAIRSDPQFSNKLFTSDQDFVKAFKTLAQQKGERALVRAMQPNLESLLPDPLPKNSTLRIVMGMPPSMKSEISEGKAAYNMVSGSINTVVMSLTMEPDLAQTDPLMALNHLLTIEREVLHPNPQPGKGFKDQFEDFGESGSLPRRLADIPGDELLEATRDIQEAMVCDGTIIRNKLAQKLGIGDYSKEQFSTVRDVNYTLTQLATTVSESPEDLQGENGGRALKQLEGHLEKLRSLKDTVPTSHSFPLLNALISQTETLMESVREIQSQGK
ncbi:hypothetical protein DB346_11295 [Verrucomicrobia bacterium LW23]|nr:hypothetical protein DB346_11295 [Verrucomicrobia bacterium LW23]